MFHKSVILLFKPFLSILASFATLLFGYASFLDADIFDSYFENYPISTPAIISEWESNEDIPASGDFYVSTKGNDNNDGSKEKPFRSIEKAQEAIRNSDEESFTVLIEAGEYRVNSLSLGVQGKKTEFIGYGSGETVINGDYSLKNNSPVYKHLPDFESLPLDNIGRK